MCDIAWAVHRSVDSIHDKCRQQCSIAWQCVFSCALSVLFKTYSSIQLMALFCSNSMSSGSCWLLCPLWLPSLKLFCVIVLQIRLTGGMPPLTAMVWTAVTTAVAVMVQVAVAVVDEQAMRVMHLLLYNGKSSYTFNLCILTTIANATYAMQLYIKFVKWDWRLSAQLLRQQRVICELSESRI